MRLTGWSSLILILCCGGGRVVASSYPQATLTVTGGEQKPNGMWDAGNITVSFNGFLEIVNYGQYSSPSSLASALAAMFTRDYYGFGLRAKANVNNDGSDRNVVTFQLTNGRSFGPISYALSPTSFAVTPIGFTTPTSILADSGTVTLQVNGATIASASYGDGATPSSIAEGLVVSASNSASALVTVKANAGLLYLQSKQTGGTVNYSYSLNVAHDTADFPNPSFEISPMSGAMTGGASPNGQAPAPMYFYNVGYAENGNVTSLGDSVMGGWIYGYDSLNRLTSAQAPNGAYGSQCLLWSYDGFGNRIDQSVYNNASCQGTAADTATVTGANNQLVSVTLPHSQTIKPTYDAGGNLLTDGTNTYVYDAENRICAVHGPLGMTGYQYDAEGHRVGKGMISAMSCDVTTNGYQPTNSFVLDLAGGQMTEMAVEENGAEIWVHTNVIANGSLFATYDQTGLHFHLNDPLGTRRRQTDYAGVPEQSCLSLPFGDQLNCTASNDAPTEHHFTGKERDTESGLDYFGARYYPSNMGRWMSPDWSAQAEPIPYASLSNPQTLNLYAFVDNNPLSSLDRDGHEQANGLTSVSGFYGGLRSGPPTPAEILEEIQRNQMAKLSEAQQQNLPAPDANHNHTIVVREVSGQGANIAGHITVQVDGGAEVGFGPKRNMTTTEVLENKSVPGQVEPRAAGVKTLDAVTINVTAAQASAAQGTIDARARNPGDYRLVGCSCVNFGAQVVVSGGGRAPKDYRPSALVGDIRAQQYRNSSTQSIP